MSVDSSRKPGAGSSQSALLDPPSHAAKRKTSASVWGMKFQGTDESISTARAFATVASAATWATELLDRRTIPPGVPMAPRITFKAAIDAFWSAAIAALNVILGAIGTPGG